MTAMRLTAIMIAKPNRNLKKSLSNIESIVAGGFFIAMPLSAEEVWDHWG